jgi:hypothetical protein
MRLKTTIFFVVIGLAILFTSLAFADGEMCSASDKKESERALRKAEDAEKAGRNKEAYQIATGFSSEPACATNGYKRRDDLIERTSKKLGAEAEKSGRFGDAFEYYSAPYQNGHLDYPLADSDRAMLKHANASPDDYKVISQAVSYFDSREGKPHLKEVHALAKRGGDKMLAKEEKTFAARKDSLNDLQRAREWFDLAGEGKRAQARAEQRGDTLLAEGSFRSVERAFSYYDFAENPKKTNAAKARALKLGDDAARKGDNNLAEKFYELSGDESKAAAVQKVKEETEQKRQKQFKKEQEDLEKELGM